MSRRRKIARLLPYLAVDGVIILIIIMLIQLDLIVNQTLYDYGLTFSYDWALLYWTIIRIIYMLLITALATTTILGATSYSKTKREETETVYICKSCGKAYTTIKNNINVTESLPKFKVLKACPSCSKKLQEE
jgi:DNA-directed RNA polymerase subunit RPC12/RpoP